MDRLDGLLRELRAFVVEREWGQFHDPKNLAMAIASEAGELLAEYRWVGNEEADDYSQDGSRRERIAAEAADIGISLMLFCERVGINLIEEIQRKLEVNRRNYPVDRSRGRPDRPG
ncbi:MAG: nucleotide pyrophosphohydrolase [Candidatus Rokubacteria bacterium]|nr:nucleotide pyrophosphohydrolase [Candidatus Rokubacteria bacterium]MBI3454680.1 nucleotide pyrophosphohydrolase [Candidatus Rokubacteria bacterium]